MQFFPLLIALIASFGMSLRISRDARGTKRGEKRSVRMPRFMAATERSFASR